MCRGNIHLGKVQKQGQSEATLNVWETTAGGAATFQMKAWGRRELKINLSSGMMPQ